MTNLIHLSHLLTAAWAAAGELITATAILAALNTAANAIRWTYQAGAATGRLLWPVIHFAVAVFRQIDWQFAMTVALECTVAIAVALWIGGKWSHKTLIAVSASLGRWYASVVVPAAAVEVPVAAPVARRVRRRRQPVLAMA